MSDTLRRRRRTALFLCPVVQIFWSLRHGPQSKTFHLILSVVFLFVLSKPFLPLLYNITTPTAAWVRLFNMVLLKLAMTDKMFLISVFLLNDGITVSIIFYETSDTQFIINKCIFFVHPSSLSTRDPSSEQLQANFIRRNMENTYSRFKKQRTGIHG